MSASVHVTGIANATSNDGGVSMTTVVATVCLIWYVAVAIVCTVGYTQMYRSSLDGYERAFS